MNNPIADYLYHRLPEVYRKEDKEEILKRFLELWAEGGYQGVYNETRDVMDLLDVDKCPSKFLPQLCAMYGYEYTLDIPELFVRRLLKYIVEMYKRKGTKSVVRFIARELTGFDSEIVENKDFSPEYEQITGWDKRFEHYRNFVLKLSAPYEDSQLFNREDIVIKIIKDFLPTNSQCLTITMYWFREDSELVKNSVEDIKELVKDYNSEIFTRKVLEVDDTQVLKKWIDYDTKNIQDFIYTNAERVIMLVESYNRTVVSGSNDSYDTFKSFISEGLYQIALEKFGDTFNREYVQDDYLERFDVYGKIDSFTNSFINGIPLVTNSLNKWFDTVKFNEEAINYSLSRITRTIETTRMTLLTESELKSENTMTEVETNPKLKEIVLENDPLRVVYQDVLSYGRYEGEDKNDRVNYSHNVESYKNTILTESEVDVSSAEEIEINPKYKVVDSESDKLSIVSEPILVNLLFNVVEANKNIASFTTSGDIYHLATDTFTNSYSIGGIISTVYDIMKMQVELESSSNSLTWLLDSNRLSNISPQLYTNGLICWDIVKINGQSDQIIYYL